MTVIMLMACLTIPSTQCQSQDVYLLNSVVDTQAIVEEIPTLIADAIYIEEGMDQPISPPKLESNWEPQRKEWGSQVEQWRPLVAGQFSESKVETAMCLMYYESKGNPDAKNPNSTASGLFQILRFWWKGEFNLDPFVPEQNVWMAAQIQLQQGWGAWSPYNRGLCHGL